jgi:2-succinyl-5-enolpyruvyl-6-hydroxy-3-cyclohexene-1-carboxylate synthase
MKASNPSQALARTLIDEFARAGLGHACLSPGSRSAPLAMALEEDGRIALHISIDERSASFLAIGIAKATRRPVMLVSTSGTAAANFHPAVIEAAHSKTPLVVVTADRPPELRDTGAGQTIDQLKLYGDAVRWFAEIGVPEARSESVAYWRSLAARAYATSCTSPMGPVHLNAAFREPLVPTPGAPSWDLPLDGRPDGGPWVRVDPTLHAPSEAQVRSLAEEIERSERGLIVAGDCDVDPRPVLELADAAAWPVFADPLSGLRTGPHAISTYDALLRSPELAAAHRPDVVLRIGKTGLSKSLAAFLSSGVRQILIDGDGTWLDPERDMARLVRADPSLLFAEASKALSGRRSGWLERWRQAEAAARVAIDEMLDASDGVSEARTARDLARHLPDDATLVTGSSMPVRELDRHMSPRSGLRVLANRGANGIDGFVSTTLGVALSTTGRTVALAGDLSMLHDQNGLLLGRDEAIDATFVVLNNNGGGIFSYLPQAGFPASFERLFGTPHGVDFATLAKVYGCGHRLLERASQLDGALDQAHLEKGVQLVEIRTDRSESVALHRRLQEAVARAVTKG